MNKKEMDYTGTDCTAGIFSYSLRHKEQQECRSEQQ